MKQQLRAQGGGEGSNTKKISMIQNELLSIKKELQIQGGGENSLS
jgi:hypothetical protein